MDPSNSQDDTDGTDLTEEVEDFSTTRNTMSGSASAAVQAGMITGGVTQNTDQSTRNTYHVPGGWIGTVLLACSVILSAVLLVKAVDDDPPEQSRGDDSAVPLVAAVKPVTDPCSSDWFTSKPADEVRALLSEGEPRSWTDLAPLAEGASADRGLVMVTLQGLHPDRSVMITGIGIEVLSREPPPPGILLDAPCGGSDNYRHVDIDLDQPRPRAVGRPVDSNAVEEAHRKGWRVDPIAFPYEITSTDAETFLLDATTASCDCTWIAHFDWSAGGRTGRLTVPDGGSFRAVSSANATRCSTLTGLTCG
ncbi:hypothetical protein [Saccharothrix xinjiangensis]|uniref:Uncharacterized protein n=1 Tax=Saccharothrix xinjiangensis TaxID=204798 RepID=A0ABV9Y4R7_9PSEU